jgi:hypothetical protein
MNYVLRNPPRVYRQQRAGRSATYRAERTTENSRHVRVVVPIHHLIEQLRAYVVQRCSHNCKKTKFNQFSNYTNFPRILKRS